MLELCLNSQSRRATNCATPRYLVFAAIRTCSQSRRATNCATPGDELYSFLLLTSLFTVCFVRPGCGAQKTAFFDRCPCCDSLFLPPAALVSQPKAGALPTALHPVMNTFNCFGRLSCRPLKCPLSYHTPPRCASITFPETAVCERMPDINFVICTKRHLLSPKKDTIKLSQIVTQNIRKFILLLVDYTFYLR